MSSRAPQVFALAAEMPDRFRALILLATFASLRWGEVTALQRQDLEVVVGPKPGGASDELLVVRAQVHVRRAVTEQRGTGLVLGSPKSRAGRRTLTIPPVIVPGGRVGEQSEPGVLAADDEPVQVHRHRPLLPGSSRTTAIPTSTPPRNSPT